MADTKIKTLVIKTQNGIKVDGTDRWLPLQGADAFIDQIDTAPSSQSGSTELFNTLVSGVPSPWARVKLTEYALADNSDDDDNRILTACYRHMRSEWRGLIAAYVLYSDRFTLSNPISLTHKDMDDTFGQFDLRSVLGDMLFNDKPLWKYTAQEGKTDETAPKIQLLYYKAPNSDTKELVAATSPFTLFFASANYSLQSSKGDIYWIDDSGKFTDPTDKRYGERFNDPQYEINIKKIVSFLKNINANREKYRDAFVRIGGDAIREQVQNICRQIGSFIDRWLRDIRAINPKWEDIDNNSMPVTINSAVVPSGILANLFETNYTYYWYDGTFLLSDQTNAVRIESVRELFIDSRYIVGVKSSAEDVEKFVNAPVTYMHAKDANSGQDYFLALPFSRFAIEECFKSEISQIILGNNDKVKLRTEIKAGVVKVVLQARFTTSDWVDILSKEFTIVEPDTIGHVFTWPNFASSIWNRYYFYNEYPTNGSGIRVLPIFEKLDGTAAVDFEKTSSLTDEMKEMFLVRYPVGKVDTSAHRYEILRSEYPVKLLAIKVDRDEKECPAGYLMIKTRMDGTSGSDAMHIIKTEADNLSKVSVGVDFGSTNTCAYYRSDKEEQANAIPFANRRLALIGFDNVAGNLAQKHELYFISNEAPVNKNGQIKSWLHLHNTEYIEAAKTANELVGGVPVNETNITVKEMTENEIITNAGTLCSNMKWLSDKKGNDSKNSYMATIWLQICADLFDKGMYPNTLRWSYPSAMSRRDINSMSKIYRTLRDVTPIEGVVIRDIKSHTESEAVCSYAITKNVALTDKRLFLGIDIGGSTSDILIMGRNASGAKQLYSQCSLRIAANHFFKAINASASFRKALYKFHESKITKVRVINIADIINSDQKIYSRSPYYLNNIFDQLSNNEFDKFYNSLSKDVPFVFALPSYISGILAFYSGLLVRNAIATKNISGIESVNMRYYGKGGRTFEWLYRVYEDDAKVYFAECFKAGFGSPVKFSCDNVEEMRDGTVENKSEVAMGLVNLNGDIVGVYNSSEEDSTTPQEFMSEVFGEQGFSYTTESGERVAIDEMDIVSGDFYKNLHNPETFANFFKFIDIYCKLLSNTGIINDTDLIQELKKQRCNVDNVMQFFDNDNEYTKYKNEMKGADEDSKPSYRMPIFIAEALYYLEKVLLPTVFRE